MVHTDSHLKMTQDSLNTRGYTPSIIGFRVHTRLGILAFNGRPTFYVLPYGTLESADIYDIEATYPIDSIYDW